VEKNIARFSWYDFDVIFGAKEHSNDEYCKTGIICLQEIFAKFVSLNI
jgi:hypothetical protein